MSFLYKALLKSNADKNGNQTAPTASGEHQATPAPNFNHVPAGQNGYQPHHANMPMFAEPNANSNGATMWLVVALLLLVIGVLAGYILGQNHQPFITGSETPIATSEANFEQGPNGETNGRKQAVDTGKNIELTAQDNQPSTTESTIKEPVTGKYSTAQKTGNVTSELTSEIKPSSELKQPAQPVSQQTNGEVSSMVAIAEANNAADVADEERTEIEAEAPQEYVVSGNEVVPIEQVSEQLRSQFAMAVEATESLDDQSISEPNITSESSLVTIHELSAAERAGIPPLYYGTHMYATDRNERYVKINNQTLKEGDELMPGLKLLEIRLDIIVWETRYQRFAQEALDDFEG